MAGDELREAGVTVFVCKDPTADFAERKMRNFHYEEH